MIYYQLFSTPLKLIVETVSTQWNLISQHRSHSPLPYFPSCDAGPSLVEKKQPEVHRPRVVAPSLTVREEREESRHRPSLSVSVGQWGDQARPGHHVTVSPQSSGDNRSAAHRSAASCEIKYLIMSRLLDNMLPGESHLEKPEIFGLKQTQTSQT